MKRICMAALCMAWLMGAAGVSLAQEPVPTLKLPNTEVYGSFIVTSPDYGNKWSDFLLKGFEVGASKGFTDHLWLTTSFDFDFGNPTIPNTVPEDPLFPIGAPVPMHIKQFSATLGPKYYFRTLKHIRPYATGQIGYARQASDGFYAHDHHPPLPIGTRIVEQGFTYRFGGGAEWQFKTRLYWRIAQWDWQPMPWGRHTPFYSNLGTGIGYRF